MIGHRNIRRVGVLWLVCAAGAGLGSRVQAGAILGLSLTDKAADPGITSVDLDAEGSLDWHKWGEPAGRRSEGGAGAVGLIGPLAQVGLFTVTNQTGLGEIDAVLSWTNGIVPNVAGSDNGLLWANDAADAEGPFPDLDHDEGWTFNVALPSPGVYVLKVYIGGRRADFRFNVSLDDDGIAADTLNGRLRSAGSTSDQEFEVVVSAGSSNASLTVEYLHRSGGNGGGIDRLGIKAASLDRTGELRTEYYVATGGDDGNPGTPEAPFATLQRAADMAVAGDTVYLRGGRYHEGVTLTGLKGLAANPITFRNYGDEEPVLAGTVPLTNQVWSVHTGAVYKTTLAEDIRQLFVGGRGMTAARWPNAGNWADPDTSSGRNPTPGSYWDLDGTWGRLAAPSEWGHFHNDDASHDLAATGKSFEGAALVLFRALVTGNDIVTELVTGHTAGASDFTHSTVHHAAGSSSSQPVSGARYFIEGDLDCLDQPGEWFYDADSGELYVWFEDSGPPDGRRIEGKTRDYVLTLNQCAFLDIQGITLFGGAFKLDGTYDTRFDQCRFLYPSYGKRMLGIVNPGGAFSPATAPYNMTLGGRNPANLEWTDCEFAYNEGIGLYLRTHGNLVENCWFHNGQFGPTLYGAVSDKKGSTTTLRRNTFHTLGVQNATKNGPHGLIVENHAYNFMFPGDFSVYQVPTGSQGTTVLSNNWAINGFDRNGVRFDGDPAGTNCTVHRMVSAGNMRGFRLKGDRHRIFQLTGVDNHPKIDINIAHEKFYGYDENGDPIQGRRGSDPYHGNAESIVRNIAGDTISNWPLAATNHGGVWHGEDVGTSLRDELRDPDNLDFRPRAGSELVDAGMVAPGYTDGYLGAAPDIGAYEWNCTNYWIPGCRFETATTPIPPNGAVWVKPDADLMWLEGREAVAHDVYFGLSSGGLTFMGTQVNNLFDPGPLASNTVYYWRIDTVTTNGAVPGDEWHFDTSASGGGGGTNRPPFFNAVTITGLDGWLGLPYGDDIGPEALDLDGDPMVFAKTAGPAWLNVASNGVLSGTPVIGDEGGNQFTVTVRDNQAAQDEATLSIAVAIPTYADWQAEHFTPVEIAGGLGDQAEDADGDGVTNGDEFGADTDPRQAASLPSLSIEWLATPAGAQLSFPSSAARLYSSDFASGLAAPSWTGMTNNLPGTGSTMTLFDPTGPTRRFYRLGTRLPAP